MLDENEVYVSAKTLCCPLDSPSKLIYALICDKALANSFVRISLSHLTTDEEINDFIKIFYGCIKELVSNGKISRDRKKYNKKI